MTAVLAALLNVPQMAAHNHLTEQPIPTVLFTPQRTRKREASSLESCGGSCLPIDLASFVVGLLARPSPAPHRLRARIPSSFDESATQNDFNLSVDRPKIVGSPLGYRLVDCRIQPEKELFTLGFSPFAGSRTLALLGRHSASGLLVPPGH